MIIKSKYSLEFLRLFSAIIDQQMQILFSSSTKKHPLTFRISSLKGGITLCNLCFALALSATLQLHEKKVLQKAMFHAPSLSTGAYVRMCIRSLQDRNMPDKLQRAK